MPFASRGAFRTPHSPPSLLPTFADFRRLASAATLVPVWDEVLFDTCTAVDAYHRICRPPFGFLLESVVGGERWARYTFLGTEPRSAWRLSAGAVHRWAPEAGWTTTGSPADPLADFAAMLARHEPARIDGLPRFWGGLVGFFGYDVVRHIEHLPAAPADELGLPDALFIETGAIIAIDNLFGRAKIIAAVDMAGDHGDLRSRYDAAAEEIAALRRRLEDSRPLAPLALRAEPAEDPPFRSTFSRERFEASVRRIQEYIVAGDAFQVVLSQRLSLPLGGEPFDLYRVLRTLNPSPYMFFLDLDGFQLVGASPEVLVRVEDGRVAVRPIAGTRRRGATPEEDERLAADLLADPKELAEHLMLLDLGRNDVGRVAQYASVRVTQRNAIERYSHVLHMVSTVEGELRPELGVMDALRAAFPAGTVSGAPKVRAMQIIDELEPARRGPYAGAAGWFGYGGEAMDVAIAIRTVVAQGGQAHVQAGAGIVADSVPATEYEETLSKARALLRAVQMASGS